MKRYVAVVQMRHEVPVDSNRNACEIFNELMMSGQCMFGTAPRIDADSIEEQRMERT